MPKRLFPVLTFACSMAILAGCEPATTTPVAAALRVQAWALPGGVGAAQPDLSQGPEGSLLLSWVDRAGEQQRLSFSRFSQGFWDQPREITRGDGIGSGVDTPHLRVAADKALWAQWLRKKEGEPHARDVVFARSSDHGASWSPPQALNLDDTPTEHGFAAMWPQGASGMGIAWLDGRATAHTPMDHAAHAPGSAKLDAATMLRSADFAPDLSRSNETTVDAATCDCCQTDVTASADGALLAYRDRSPREVRDIALLRRRGKGWSAPVIVHADDWVMGACPINGPAIASAGGTVAVAWYTGAGNVPSVRLAFSDNGGEKFAAPVELARGSNVLGHVDVALDAKAAWVAWLLETKDGQSLRLARVDRGSGAVRQGVVAQLQAHGRDAGVPKLVLHEGRAWLVWTDAIGDRPSLHGAIASFE
jgi:hypothetical protein